jgi:hypothetical protein
MIRGYSTLADIAKFDEEDYAAGRECFFHGVAFYSGATPMWRRGWLSARDDKQAIEQEQRDAEAELLEAR